MGLGATKGTVVTVDRQATKLWIAGKKERLYEIETERGREKMMKDT